jgi:tetratricopeptide (TPR) repeat protein
VNAAEEPERLQSEAQALIALGRNEQALEVLARASALDPEAVRSHLLRAQALLALGRGDEAHEAAAAAAARAPESSHAHRLLALAELARGDAKQAREDALRSVALAPDEALCFVVLGQALQATRDEAGALAAARRAIELAPSSSSGYALEGRLLLAHGDAAGAEAALRRGLALAPENDAMLNNLAIALQRQGHRDEAAAALEAAARIAPASQTIRGNVLRFGRRRVPYVRGLGILVAVIGLIEGVGAGLAGEVGGIAVGAGLLVLGIAAYDLSIRMAYRGLPRPSAELVRDDYEARRYKPWRWDLSWIPRLRPWWWIMLQRVSPPVALLVNVGIVALAVTGGAVVAMTLFGLALPMSAWRVWRWYRREHPSASSWRPPA